MSISRSVLFTVAIAFAYASASPAADKDIDKDKIVGTWTMTKQGGKDAPFPLEIEFTKDGKIKLLGMELGSYKIDGNKITLTAKKKDGKDDTDTNTIKELTAQKMVLYDEKKKEEVEFKKK